MDKSTRLSSISCGEILFAFSSIYWLSGIANLLKATFYGATRVITTKSYSPEYFLELIEKYKVKHIFASLQQINSALKDKNIQTTDLSSVSSVVVGGRKLPHNDYAAIRNYFKNAVLYNMFGKKKIISFRYAICLFTFYSLGLSELGGAISVSRGFQLTLNGRGKLMNGIKVKIVDQNGNRLVIGERGRIFVKSDYYFNGYYGKAEIGAFVDKENFLKTGEFGYFDVDGYLHVLGRECDMIRYENIQIVPEEIEEVLSQHPAVKCVCVVGVNNLVTALIVRNGTISENEVYTLISGTFT